MKTIIIKLAFVLALTLTVNACTLWQERPDKQATWVVVNNSGIDLNIVVKAHPNSTYILKAGESYSDISSYRFEMDDLYFDMLFTVPDDYYEIKTKYGSRTLAKWYYSEKNNEGKQYFNEKSWIYEENKKHSKKKWTFEINPEDLAETK